MVRELKKPIRGLTAVLLVAGTALWSPARAEEALVTYKALSLETALKLARAALASCRKQGYQVAVAVVDRGGNRQVLLRDRFAGAHTPDTATRKAWTAVSFRTSTLELGKLAKPGTDFFALHNAPGALLLGGGAVIQAGGSTVGGVGISGGPGGEADEKCATAGIKAVEDELNF